MTSTTITHEIPPAWNNESRILILGTMPSPANAAWTFERLVEAYSKIAETV